MHKIIKKIRNILVHRYIRITVCTFLLAVFCIVLTALHRAELKAPEPSLILLDRHGRFLAQVCSRKDQGYGYWPIEKLPKRVAAATLALEDRRFWNHPGVDIIAVCRAAWQNLCAGHRISGASTIAMQTARMQSPGPRTYLRKSVEALTALFLTLRYGREQLFRHYLRLVPYGNNGHGIAYAGRRYLDKPVDDLSWAEIAFLSAIPQSPGTMNPFTSSGRRRAVERGRRILETLHGKGLMPDEEFDLAITQINNLKIPEKEVRPVNAIHAILKLENMFSNDPSLISGFREPRIFTTLDLKLQDTAFRTAAGFLRQWQARGADNLAVIITRRKTREVLAWVGSADYFSSEGGAIDFTQIQRSPGSTLKPFIFAHALDRGYITPATILDDLESVAKGFSNADMRFSGPLLPRLALANSRNVPAVNLVQTIGTDETYLFLQSLGLHNNEQPARYYGLGLAIGTLPVSLEKLVRSYGALANEGLLGELIWYKKQPDEKQRILPEPVVRQISLFLSDPMARLPSFPRMGATEYPFPVAVKTGTSQGYRNAWAVAWSKDYLIGVWTGRTDNKPMKKLGGSASSACLAQELLLHLHRKQISGMADLAFPPPKGYQPVEICTFSGMKSTGNCEKTFQEWFPPGQLPAHDNICRSVPVDIRNGLLATPWTPDEMTEHAKFANLPARYTVWALSNRISLLPKGYSPIDIPFGRIDSAVPFSVALSNEQPVSLIVESPQNGLRIFSNPDIPPAMNSIALRVTAEPDVAQVLWYVDGKPFKLTDAPYTVRWPLEYGSHTFQARLPFRNEVSKTVRVIVE